MYGAWTTLLDILLPELGVESSKKVQGNFNIRMIGNKVKGVELIISSHKEQEKGQ